jgi:hypothetical protein
VRRAGSIRERVSRTVVLSATTKLRRTVNVATNVCDGRHVGEYRTSIMHVHSPVSAFNPRVCGIVLGALRQ